MMRNDDTLAMTGDKASGVAAHEDGPPRQRLTAKNWAKEYGLEKYLKMLTGLELQELQAALEARRTAEGKIERWAASREAALVVVEKFEQRLDRMREANKPASS